MRLRITFSKSGSLRYIGHLDLHALWERTIRRAGLPLMYTQGFHPGPRIQLASALPLGFIGRSEIIDIWLEDSSLHAGTLPIFEEFGEGWGRAESQNHNELGFHSDNFSRHLIQTIQPSAPPGLTLLSVEPVDEHSPALQTQVLSAEYEVSFLDPLTAEQAAELPDRITALLASPSLPAERRGKPYDLRPLIESLSLVGAVREPPIPACIFMRLAAREGATGRPEAVLAALGLSSESARIERTRILLKNP